MESAELELQIGATRAFILADCVELSFTRRDKMEDNGGGFVFSEPYPLAPQTCRLIPQSDRVPELQGQDGRMAVPEFIILLEPGSDMARYDRFQWSGRTWEIAQVHSKPSYEMKGDVIQVGG